jgi:hypothetical protein
MESGEELLTDVAARDGHDSSVRLRTPLKVALKISSMPTLFGNRKVPGSSIVPWCEPIFPPKVDGSPTLKYRNAGEVKSLAETFVPSR